MPDLTRGAVSVMQVADFGLAKLSNDTHTHVSTRIMGTFGCVYVYNLLIILLYMGRYLRIGAQ